MLPWNAILPLRRLVRNMVGRAGNRSREAAEGVCRRFVPDPSGAVLRPHLCGRAAVIRLQTGSIKQDKQIKQNRTKESEAVQISAAGLLPVLCPELLGGLAEAASQRGGALKTT